MEHFKSKTISGIAAVRLLGSTITVTTVLILTLAGISQAADFISAELQSSIDTETGQHQGYLSAEEVNQGLAARFDTMRARMAARRQARVSEGPPDYQLQDMDDSTMQPPDGVDQPGSASVEEGR